MNVSWSFSMRMPEVPKTSDCKKPPAPVMKLTVPPSGVSVHTP